MTRSPRLDGPLPEHPAEPLTKDALSALMELASLMGARSIALGHGRDEVSQHNASLVIREWEARGGGVLAEVTWPEDAASWLRQARAFTEPEPDLWLLGGVSAGIVQLTRRLRWSTSWRASRTLMLCSPGQVDAMLDFVGDRGLHGLRGAHPDGMLWEIVDDTRGPLHPGAIERRTR